MYVLVIMTWIGGVISGYQIHTLEFSTKDTCTAAITSLQEAAKENTYSYKIPMVCIPK